VEQLPPSHPRSPHRRRKSHQSVTMDNGDEARTVRFHNMQELSDDDEVGDGNNENDKLLKKT